MILISFFAFVSANAQSNLITANSAGKVKMGMTVAEARKAVAPLKLERTSDGEGVALIAVVRGDGNVMTLYAGEEDATAQLNEKARIEQIWVWDRSFKTAEGVHPEMSLAEAGKKYGGVREVTLTEIESREFAKFKNHPEGIEFRLVGKDDYAGVYPPNADRTTSFNPGAYIFSINVTGNDSTQSEPVEAGVTFSSEYTDLKTDCRSEGGEEGGHVSTFCKGPAGYQIHYFDTAATLEFNAENEEAEFVVKLASEGLAYVERNSKIEWRLADGKPFAAIMRVFTYREDGEFPKQGEPTGAFLIVKGLKGHEHIDGRIDAKTVDANERARELADNSFADQKADTNGIGSDGGAMRIYFAGESTKATTRGMIVAPDDPLKYIVKANAGDRLTVNASADKWAGEEGPVLVVFVTSPNGEGEGQPGGFDEVLTQDGDHEILIHQNKAKSQAENIELTATITVTPKGE